jgi:hypothetical protein
METSWHAINDLDLTKGTTDRKASARPSESLSESEKADLMKRDKGFWTWKRAGVGVAALAAVGVGAVFLLPNDPPASHQSVTPPPPGKRSSGIDSLPLPN